MRDRGHYIIDYRCKFKRGKQKEFLRRLKKVSRLTWRELAEMLDVGIYTIQTDWHNENSTLPLKKMEEIIGKYPDKILKKIVNKGIDKVLEPKWGQKKAGNLKLKEIILPQRSENLAEIIGALIGDGNISQKGIRITGNYKEKKHHEYLRKEIKALFGLDSRIYGGYTKKSVIILNLYSTKIVSYFNQEGIKTGNKMKNRIRIPWWIFTQKKFMYGALRGLFDTDGGIYLKQEKYERVFIEFQNHCPETMEDIFRLIKEAGFTPSKSSINSRIQDQKEVKKFFRLVGSANPKNIIRYKTFIKSDFIPKKEEMEKEVSNYTGEQPFKCGHS